MNRLREQGFTLVELMIVVLIIGVLVAIAVPVYANARQNASRKACFSNERAVEGAFYSYVASAGVPAGQAVTDWSGLMDVLLPSFLSTEPACPESGVYTWSNQTVFCDDHGTYHDGPY